MACQAEVCWDCSQKSVNTERERNDTIPESSPDCVQNRVTSSADQQGPVALLPHCTLKTKCVCVCVCVCVCLCTPLSHISLSAAPIIAALSPHWSAEWRSTQPFINVLTPPPLRCVTGMSFLLPPQAHRYNTLYIQMHGAYT